jgi:hypothetical protein
VVFESNLHGGNGIVQGDAFPVTRTVTRVPPGNTITNAWLTLKSTYDSLDTAALFQKAITPSPSSDGLITNPGAGGVGEVLFEVTSSNTLSMVADEEYYYDIQVKLSNGNIRTIERGVTSAMPQVTVNA